MNDHTELWQLYCRHRADLFSYALSLTRNAAMSEDALHSAFAAAAETPKKIRNPRAYLFRSLRNECFRITREEPQRAALPPDALSYLVSSEPTAPKDTTHHGHRNGALLKALDALPDERREVVMLRFYSRLRFREIARVMDRPLPTVASHYRRALKQLAQLLEAAHDDA